MSNLHIVRIQTDVEILYFCELTDVEKKNVEESYDNAIESSFFRYMGYLYDMSDFMRIDHNAGSALKGYDAYHGDSYFSGTLIKLDNHGEFLTVATYYS